MPRADASRRRCGFAAPLFRTLLSIVILKEKVGVHRWELTRQLGDRPVPPTAATTTPSL